MMTVTKIGRATFAVSLFLFLVATAATSQPLSFANDEFASVKSVISLDDEGLMPSIFFTDQENKLLFIDFEELGEEVIELTLVQADKVLIKDNTSNLPKNTIYELDLKPLKKGDSYKLLISTPFGTLSKSFSVM